MVGTRMPFRKFRRYREHPRTYHLCNCWQCNGSTSIDPTTGQLVDGQYISLALWKEHESKSAETGLSPPVTSHGAANIQSQELPAAARNPKIKRRARTQENFVPARKCSKALINRLQSIKFRLSQSRLQDVKDAFSKEPPVFVHTPSHSSPENPPSYDLDGNAPQNKLALEEMAWLHRVRDLIVTNDITRSRDSAHSRILANRIMVRIDEELNGLDRLRKDLWEEMRMLSMMAGPSCIDTSAFFQRSHLAAEPVTLSAYLIVLVLYILAGVSMNISNFVLNSMVNLLSTGRNFHGTSTTRAPGSTSSIPADIRTILKVVPLQPVTRTYVCCPKCYCTYGVNSEDSKAYPEKCQQPTSIGGPICGRRLRKSDTADPTRTFLYQDMKHWIGWMLNRPDIAHHLERNPLETSGKHGKMSDIWDGQILRNFKDQDEGGAPFVRSLDDELRFILSFNQDSLNPYGNRAAKKVVHIGGMYMALLNLPPEIRHNPENIYFVGVIPGPAEPSTDEINHLLRPLVDDLLIFWKEGVRYSRTLFHPHGVRVRCAMIPLVCDLPAACQISGFGAFQSKDDCHDCHHTRDMMDNIEYQSWVPRDPVEHRRIARRWRDAPSQAKRDSIYKKHHIRWSELLRLEYWDPTKFVVIDSMHCFYLGLFNRHCRKVWGMDAAILDGDGITFDSLKKEPSKEQMRVGRALMETGSTSDLSALGVNVLSKLCREFKLRYGLRRTKGKLLESLEEYRVQQGWGVTNSDQKVSNNDPANITPITASLDIEHNLLY